MQAHEIEHYLAELGAALENQGISKPVRMMLRRASLPDVSLVQVTRM